ncbi:MAG: MFS transporter [Nevskia sp.]|nr:MFS transporter [Nevskia sp.]
MRYAEFRNLTLGVFLFTIAILAQEVVLGYQLYALTRDPLVLGFTGLAEALPFIALALFGGHLADRGDRRRIILLAAGFVSLGSAVLLWVTLPSTLARISQTTLLITIYGVIAALGLARGFFSPAASSLTAFIVPRQIYGNAAAWRSSGWQCGAIVGPLCAGFLYAALGLTGTLAVIVALMLGALLLFTGLKPRPPQPRQAGAAETGLWQSLREGIDFVFRTPIILYSISLDLFSVLFGGVMAILPIFATDILHGGAEGLGVLRAAPSVGAVLTLLACTRYPPTHHAWRNLLIVVAGFGVATLLFALSRWFWLSVAALFLTGAFDSVSVVIRGTILQIMPPDHLRGRVVSVNGIFLAASNELGAFESGLAARLMGTVPSVILGGSLTLLTVLYVWRRSKALFAVKLA